MNLINIHHSLRFSFNINYIKSWLCETLRQTCCVGWCIFHVGPGSSMIYYNLWKFNLTLGNLEPKHMSVTQFDRRVPLDKATSSAPYTQHYHIMTNILTIRDEIIYFSTRFLFLTILRRVWPSLALYRLTHKLGFRL